MPDSLGGEFAFSSRLVEQALIAPAALLAIVIPALPASAQDAPALYGPPELEGPSASPVGPEGLASFALPGPVQRDVTPAPLGMGEPEPRLVPVQASESGAGGEDYVLAEPKKKGPLFPIWGDKARERGIDLPPAFGIAGMTIGNRQTLQARNLAVNIAKGGTIAPDAGLFEVPFVVPHDLKSDTYNTQFKADLWVLPFLDVFLAVGKSRGNVDVTVDIDLDAFVPFPFCRPAKPCGTRTIPFVAKVDNITVTPGAVIAYGSEHWFVSASAARTVATTSRERSNIQTTDIGFRAGPRISLGGDVILSPYVGADYFDMEVNVSGLLVSEPLFEDGDPIAMRYSVDLNPPTPWAGLGGLLLQIGRHWMLQGEYNLGADSNRFVVSASFRP